MEQLRKALSARWEGDSLKAECPVCSHQRLYVQPPDRDGLPTFVCGRGCDWRRGLLPALMRLGVPGSALRSSEYTRAAEPLPELAVLDSWPAALLGGDHPEFMDYLLGNIGLSPRQVERLGWGLARHGSTRWLSVPVYDQDWVLRQVRFWNPLRGIKFWPYTGNGARWLLGVERLTETAVDTPLLWLEGESDYGAAVAASAHAVAVVGGALAVPEDLAPIAGRDVVVCFDNDDPGRSGARKQARALLDAGARVWVADIAQHVPEPGGDLRDWLVRGSGSPAALSDWIGSVVEGEPLSLVALGEVAGDVEALDRERQRRRVRRAVDTEEVLSDWTPPPSHEHMGEELSLDERPMAWTVENLHETGTNTLVVAQYKTGKTVLALNLLKRLVDNEDFLGFKTHLPDDGRRVAWWNYELTADQARRWVRELGCEHPERLTHLPLRGYPMPLQAEPVVEWAVRWLRDHQVTCWVIDPFAEAFDGDENDNSVVRGWLQHLNEIKRRAGVEDVFLIVHTGHAEQEEGRERARGASRLEGWKDVGWYYTKHPDHGSLRFLRAFGRDVDQANFAITYDPVTRLLARDESTAGMSRAEVVTHAKAKRVREVVAQHPGIKKEELRSKLGRGGNTEKNHWIATAVDLHLIRTEPGKQRAVHHYPVEREVLRLREVSDQ